MTQVSTAAWRSETYRRLATRLDRLVGPRTAALFEPLKVRTVFDLLHHLPRRYVSGTELSDLSTLRPGEEVAVLAEVVGTQTFGTSRPAGSGGRGGFRGRLEATITDRRGKLALTFFGQPKLIAYWQKQLVAGSRGIFAGKVTEFNGRLQLAHPDFVILDEDGNVVGGTQANAALAVGRAGRAGRSLPGYRKAPHLDHRSDHPDRPRLARRLCRSAAGLDPGRGGRAGARGSTSGRSTSRRPGRESRAAWAGCGSTRRSRCS